MVRPGNLIHVAKYLPRKSPTLNNKKTVTGVKYLVDQADFEAMASDSTSTATAGNMHNVTVKLRKIVNPYTQHLAKTSRILGNSGTVP